MENSSGQAPNPPSWPPIAPTEATPAPIDISTTFDASVGPDGTWTPQLPNAQVRPAIEGTVEGTVVSPHPASETTPGTDVELSRRAIVVRRLGEIADRAAGVVSALNQAGVPDKVARVVGGLNESGALDAAERWATGRPGKAAAVVRGAVGAARLGATIHDNTQEEQDSNGGSFFTKVRYIPREREQRQQEAPTFYPFTKPSQEAGDKTSPAGGHKTPPPLVPLADTTDGKSNNPTPQPSLNSAPEVGRAHVDPWWERIPEEMKRLGLDPYLGWGKRQSEEILARDPAFWRERAQWIIHSATTQGDPDVLKPYFNPRGELQEPPVHPNKPEDRSPDHKKDHGTGKLSPSELFARGRRTLQKGSPTESIGRRMRRRWEKAQQAGFDEVDRGGGMSRDDIDRHIELMRERKKLKPDGYLHVDPDGPPITDVWDADGDPGRPWGADTRYRKLQPDPNGKPKGFGDHPSLRG